MYVGHKTYFKFKILISDRIFRYPYIFSIYFELGMKLHYLYILIKKQIFEKFKITDSYAWSVRLSNLRTELDVINNLFGDKSIFEYLRVINWTRAWSTTSGMHSIF